MLQGKYKIRPTTITKEKLKYEISTQTVRSQIMLCEMQIIISEMNCYLSPH